MEKTAQENLAEVANAINWARVHELSLHQTEQGVPVPDDTATEDEKAHKVIQRFLSWVALCPPLLDAQVKPKADTEPIKNMWPERQVNNPAEADPDTDPYDVDMESESILRPLKKLKGIEQTGNTGQETAMSKF